MSASIYLVTLLCLLVSAATSVNSGCSAASCLNNGTCVAADDQRSSHCVCTSNYFGDRCQFNSVTKLCLVHPCRNHGRCGQEHDEGTVTCVCDPGYYGTYCNMEYNECDSNPCVHGTCIDGIDSYVCDCNGTGYTGHLCDQPVHVPVDPGEWAFLLLLLIPISLIVYGCTKIYCKRNRQTTDPVYVILDNHLYNANGDSVSMTQLSA